MANAKKISMDELLEKHDYVVITGDHGSSRLAALAFHDPSVIPVTAPSKSTIRSFGRFCELDDKSTDMIALPGTSKTTSVIGGKSRFAAILLTIPSDVPSIKILSGLYFFIAF